jgi:hypothetical protein
MPLQGNPFCNTNKAAAETYEAEVIPSPNNAGY